MRLPSNTLAALNGNSRIASHEDSILGNEESDRFMLVSDLLNFPFDIRDFGLRHDSYHVEIRHTLQSDRVNNS